MEIEVRRQDATQVRGVDALVVPTNRQLTLSWGSHLAEAVRRLAGHEVEQEATALHPSGVALGAAVVTGAGRMTGFRHLIHAAVLDLWDLSPLFLVGLKERTSRSTLRRAVENTLRVADEQGIESLVLTPMGGGIGGMSERVNARWTLEAIRTYREEHPEGSLRRVVVACLSRHAADEYELQLRAA